MRTMLSAAAAIVCGSLIAGCSSAPTTEAQPSVAAVPAVAAAPAEPAVTMVPVTPDLAALTKSARAHGYTPRSRDGTVVFCKTDQHVGTRFETMSCISQADVANVVHRADDEKQDVQAMQRKSLNQPTGN
jgi:hypothetical protein